MPRYMRIDPGDNVAVALCDMNEGTAVIVGEQRIRLLSPVPQGHKFAIADIAPGSDVIKYGASIGRASKYISAGEHVHTHNLETKLDGILEYEYRPRPEASLPIPKADSFMGYVRADNQVGTRNEIWILPTVGCVNRTADIIVEQAREALEHEPWAGKIDGVFAFPHQFGCSQLGEDHRNTQKLLVSLAKHPNAAGVLFVSLGCENNQVGEIQAALGEYDPDRIKFLTAQTVEDETAIGTRLVMELAKQASTSFRQPVPLKALKLGLKCGGSDGLSGITANPLAGWVADFVVGAGGISVLTEVPEMFGAEHLLMERASTESVFHGTVQLITEFKQYFVSHGQLVYENPSPGNRQGGITTLEEKSLGCIQKGGKGLVTAVLEYGSAASVPGLNLLCSPGNDMVAVTALAAAGCQLIIFTTGRGNPLGTCVPTVKIASNTQLYNQKRHWIDFNAGVLLDGVSIEDAAEQLLNLSLAAACGERTKSELMGFREIAIWKNGVTL